jgi:hypothetical protein
MSGGGIENHRVLAFSRLLDLRPVTCANAFTGLGGFEVCGECVGKFGFGPSCWPDCRRADLRVCQWWGYVIAVETNTIALDNSGVTRRLGPTETMGFSGPRRWLVGSPDDVPERESQRHGSCGRSCIDPAAVCACRSSFRYRDGDGRPKRNTP